jgi:hypothetical protein
MVDIIQLETDAERLRRSLRAAVSADLKILCALQFFNRYAALGGPRLEPYLRELVPPIAEAAAKCSPADFLPDDATGLKSLADLLDGHSEEVVPAEARRAIRELHHNIEDELEQAVANAAIPQAGRGDQLTCLFVEHYPELGLEPRGRILRLHVVASPAPSQVTEDIVTVHNPVAEPDDRFLSQARKAVQIAKGYLNHRYGLKLEKRHRIDYTIASNGGRFTGESLGLAMAIGAAMAVGQSEVLRESLSVRGDVAVSGALANTGVVETIDSRGLRLKIYSAFHSHLRYLVVPRPQLIEALEYLRTLEAQHPGRRLELVGADQFTTVADDTRLVPRIQMGLGKYVVRQVRRKGRTPLVEVPALIALAAVLFILIAPASWMPWFDWNPVRIAINMSTNTVGISNAGGQSLGTIKPACPILDSLNQARHVLLYDLDGDHLNEVLMMVNGGQDSEERNQLYCYSGKAELKFQRDCSIPNQYPNDTGGVQYESEHLNVFLVDGKPVIATNVFASTPARSHMRFWSARGDPLGWYINAGCCWPILVAKHNGHDEILAVCYNNRLNRTSLLAIRPDGARGCSPPYDDSALNLASVVRGNQSAYLTFLYTDVGDSISYLPYNQPSKMGLRTSDSALTVMHVAECYWRGEKPHYFTMSIDAFVLRDRAKRYIQEGARIPP